MKKCILLPLILAMGISAQGQVNELQGVIYHHTEGHHDHDPGEHPEEESIPGAHVYFAGSQHGTVTGPDGHFHLPRDPHTDSLLIISYIGFKRDTVPISHGQDFIEIDLKIHNELKEIVIMNRSPDGFVSRIDPVNTFHITRDELHKGACCNLAESFQTNASVDVSYPDAVSGAKHIRLLGLAGKYSQIQTENLPNIRGLASAYGMSYIPGQWMESIQVSKGAASVRNGYESITGHINVEYKKPDNDELFFLNLYADHEQKLEANFNAGTNLNGSWSTMLFGHAENMSNKTDINGDSFLDQPLTKQYQLFNRWKYENHTNFHLQLGIKGLYEDRSGGQWDFERNQERNTTNPYGIGIETIRYEAFAKGAVLLGEQGSLAFLHTYVYHNQGSFFGLNTYDASENNYFGSLIYQAGFREQKHQITSGMGLMIDNYDEVLNDSTFIRKETVPGIFAEYTFKPSGKLTVLAGIRADRHNIFGMLYTPRFHFKYDITNGLIMRVSAGKGYRSPNVIAENNYILATSRKLIIREEPNIEKAANYGMNFTQFLYPLGRELSIHAEFYRTDFQDRLIIDRDADPQSIYIYNLNGKSYSNSAQLEVNYEVFEGLDLLLAYRYNFVKMTINKELRRQPFVNRFKGLLNLSYATKNDAWQFNLTTHINGDARIPDTDKNPARYQRQKQSPVYTIINAQVTKKLKKWDVYIGGDNLTGFRQDDPVIAYDNPFGGYFDSSLVWGPVTGIRVYAGLRYTIHRINTTEHEHHHEE
ncbi:MAG: TonB-dependent receptor [Bacteroidales bacterium]